MTPEGQMKSKMTSSSLESGEPSQHKKVETRQEHGTRYHTPSSPQMSGKSPETRFVCSFLRKQTGFEIKLFLLLTRKILIGLV